MLEDGAQSIEWMQFIFASVTVIALLAGFAFVLRLLADRGWVKTRTQDKRIDVVATKNIDGRRRLLLVRGDQTEYLIFLGPNNDFLLSSGEAKKEE